MIFKFHRDDSTPRPPLAGRLVGLAVGVLLLSLAVYVALDVLAALVAVTVPLLAMALVYIIIVGRFRK